MKAAITEIISNALELAAGEMCATLIHSAFSPNIKERADCSTSICDVSGRTVALGTNSPAHLGSTLKMIPSVLERFPLDTLQDGDVFFANDPYIVGVTHLNDCTLLAPVFYQNEIVAFVTAVAHHSDVGGKVPGSESGDATSIYQEGVRLPPLRLIAAGELRKDILEMFLLNSRTPEFSEGDLYAQRAALKRGIARVCEVVARHGVTTVRHAISNLMEATEKRTVDAIRRNLASGTYKATEYVDDDGATGNSFALSVTALISDGQLKLDFSGSADQLASGKNVPLTHTLATVYYCVKSIIDPEIAVNDGLFRAIATNIPLRSVLNPAPPAGVSSRNLTSMILADAIISALSKAAPTRGMAASGPYQGIILSGTDSVRGRYFVDYENFAGGHGAFCDRDGMDATQVHMSNTSNLPAEVFETEFPLRVECYEFAENSCGAGKFRGGLGVCRDIRILDDFVTLALRSARQRYPANGVWGGRAGAPGAFILNPGTPKERVLPGTASEIALSKGDLLRIITPGGGGNGKPKERNREARLADLRDEKISGHAAETNYGLENATQLKRLGRSGRSRKIKPSGPG